jgi:ATP-dependent DNA ligase
MAQLGLAIRVGECPLLKIADMPHLDGLMSKRRGRPYQGGKSKYWVKIKNRKHPAMTRVTEAFG